MNNFIARTGRVQSWIDNPQSRLPVSCTVFVVEDSMEGTDGIESSLRFTSFALRHAAGVAIHLSKLRPKGTENGKGLVASGPVSFGKIYSVLNEVLRRGGQYKNGSITLHLDLSHPDILEFIEADRSELPWAKRCVDLTPIMWYEASQEVKDALLLAIKSGDVWLNKIKYTGKMERIYGNVCLEIYLRSRGTCLLEHINLPQCEIEELQSAFIQGMTELCELHKKTGVGDSGEYLSPAEDKQVGLGILGLANLLSQNAITYKEFGQQLSILNNGGQPNEMPAGKLAYALQQAINSAAVVARQHGMHRAFCIAPTATCSYNHTDKLGFTTAPEIAPPIDSSVDRDSGTFGVTSYDYGFVETAAEVGWHDFKKVADGIVKLFDNTGLFHGYSLNTWSDVVTYDEQFIEEWLHSPQTSIYYSLQVQPDTQRKDDVASLLDDEYKNMFEPISSECTEDFCPSCAE
tara:strand:+ start:3008 stop:4390 length:1383 start_codon:yes stop_codon:yes gene_type:complete